jgi:hypothetical protein
MISQPSPLTMLQSASTQYPTQDLTNTVNVVSKAAILASRKVHKKIKDRFGQVSPKRFEQCIKRAMIQRIDAVWGVCLSRRIYEERHTRRKGSHTFASRDYVSYPAHQSQNNNQLTTTSVSA